MELKAGYKQTEVGVIPEDWDLASLRSVAKTAMQNGLFFKPALKGAGVKLINVGDLFVQFPIDSESLELFGATGKEIERFGVESGDLFFTRSSIVPSGIAHCNIYISSHPEAVVFDSHVIRFRPNAKLVFPAFLARFCLATIARRYLVSNAKTGTMTTIDQGVLGQCPVLLPSLTEQAAIAEALSDADALIESLGQLITKKRHLKQGAMQELLTGKRRLPGFSGEWEVKRLGDILTIRHGKSQKAVESPDGAYPILATGGQIGWSNQFLSNKPSVLIGRKGTIDKPQFMDTPFWTVDTLFYSDIQPKNSAKFLFYRFCLVDWKQYNEASGVPSLNAGTIESVEIACPDCEEQTAIATILIDMDTELAELESRLAKARQIKQGMMQELLTGRIRLL